jgi:hypothetical protein
MLAVAVLVKAQFVAYEVSVYPTVSKATSA